MPSAWLAHCEEQCDAFCRLAGLLGLDQWCLSLVTALSDAISIGSPAAPGTALEGKQVAAFQVLVSLAGGAEASLLGSAWVIVMRCLSSLQALQVWHRHQSELACRIPIRCRC